MQIHHNAKQRHKHLIQLHLSLARSLQHRSWLCSGAPEGDRLLVLRVLRGASVSAVTVLEIINMTPRNKLSGAISDLRNIFIHVVARPRVRKMKRESFVDLLCCCSADNRTGLPIYCNMSSVCELCRRPAPYKSKPTVEWQPAQGWQETWIMSLGRVHANVCTLTDVHQRLRWRPGWFLLVHW